MSEKFDKVKKHFSDNKKLYIGIGIGVTIGVTIGVVLKCDSVQIVDAMKVQVNSPTTNNVVQVTMVRPGPKAFVVQCLETQKTWPSMREAAKDLGINPGKLSSHLSGKFPDVGGMHFEKLAEI